jgi:hypothetical protein
MINISRDTLNRNKIIIGNSILKTKENKAYAAETVG